MMQKRFEGENTMRFMDTREWIALLEKEGELRRIAAEVDWNREIGAIARRVLEKKGPALLFENIKGYAGGRCTRLFVSGLGARSRLALALGFPREVGNRELIQHVMKKNRETLAPVLVESGPVKDVIVRGGDIDQTEFPVPQWQYLEGGRYIHTFSAIVTRDPETRVMNVGLYRGMIGRKDTAPFLLIKGGQHWGAHFVKWAARKQPMPVACVIGWDPIMPFLAGSPVAAGVCEWDVMGATAAGRRSWCAARRSTSKSRPTPRLSWRATSATIRRPTRAKARSANSPATCPTFRPRARPCR
jgi:4-hydroxy-3-polyprenylbenzoate decarboxylase